MVSSLASPANRLVEKTCKKHSHSHDIILSFSLSLSLTRSLSLTDSVDSVVWRATVLANAHRRGCRRRSVAGRRRRCAATRSQASMRNRPKVECCCCCRLQTTTQTEAYKHTQTQTYGLIRYCRRRRRQRGHSLLPPSSRCVCCYTPLSGGVNGGQSILNIYIYIYICVRMFT